MREFPKGGLIGKAVHYGRKVAQLKIPLIAEAKFGKTWYEAK